MPAPLARRLNLETSGNVTIVEFVDVDIVQDATTNPIREELKALIADKKIRLLFNMGNSEKVSTHFFALLWSLHVKLQTVGGGVKICCLDGHLAEGIKLMKLPLDLYPTEQAALDAFRK
jgi:anti-anti-sigma regulatory factor